jgi:hypothetical protein
MHTSLFLTIAKAMEKHDEWFKMRRIGGTQCEPIDEGVAAV